jgi:Ca2+-binding EF-hand superfamily protein
MYDSSGCIPEDGILIQSTDTMSCKKTNTERSDRNSLIHVKEKWLEKLQGHGSQMTSLSSGGSMCHLGSSKARLSIVCNTRLTLAGMKKKRARELASVSNASLQARLDVMPEKERKTLETIFDTYDEDKSGLLESGELHFALTEAGLRGITPVERRQIALLCREKTDGKLGLNFMEFAADLLVAAHMALREYRHVCLEAGVGRCRRNWENRLVFHDMAKVVRSVLPLELLGGEDTDEDDPVAQVRRNLLAQVNERTAYFIANGENIGNLVDEVMEVAEKIMRTVFARQREVQVKYKLDESTFTRFRGELIALDSVFVYVDVDGSGRLDHKEVYELFRILGVLPKSSMEKREVMSLLEEVEKDGVNFRRFLTLITKIREMYEQRADPKLESQFYELARQNGTGGGNHENDDSASSDGECDGPVDRIGGDQLRQLLLDNGIVSNSVEKEEEARQPRKSSTQCSLVPPDSRFFIDVNVSRVLEDADPAGREEFTYKDVRRICHRLLERSSQHEMAHKLADLRGEGFTEKEMQELRQAFANVCEKTYVGQVNWEAALAVAHAAGFSFSNEGEFHKLFDTLDVDGSGFLDFVEFAKLIRLARDNIGQVDVFQEPP